MRKYLKIEYWSIFKTHMQKWTHEVLDVNPNSSITHWVIVILVLCRKEYFVIHVTEGFKLDTCTVVPIHYKAYLDRDHLWMQQVRAARFEEETG
jgi:hypothetical protein